MADQQHDAHVRAYLWLQNRILQRPGENGLLAPDAPAGELWFEPGDVDD